MEGPTPVSALLHAATMVTAGILLILRISPILTFILPLLYILILFGIMTALMSGLIACYQTDFKKIIAYSTCSQLGYMFFSCGLTLFSTSLFHLISHGFFKALLFLVAGSFIHLHLNEQSVSRLYLFENRKIGSVLSFALFIGLTALTALPYFSGFYSKEAILISAASNFVGNM
jgi:NADH:ubiquinone oxidoreductase subunit 5 (subunit L)/multisubunit Na+/H+ antiporter MnhA subunit